MPEPHKQMTLKIPISLYEEVLIIAFNDGIEVNNWVASAIKRIVLLAKEKPELISFFEEMHSEERIKCPVYQKAMGLLEIVP